MRQSWFLLLVLITDVYTIPAQKNPILSQRRTFLSRHTRGDGPLRKAKLDTKAKPPDRDEQQARTIDSNRRL
uniref:Secreted protein n=1 Tax=Angiostrongylus cantonensis TaxID=6313 RepID=A0A0K0DPD5_ANGCA